MVPNTGLSREQLLMILSSLSDIITVLDEDLRIQFLNHPDLDGASAAEMRGMPALDYVAPVRREAQREKLQSVLETGEERTFEVPITEDDGEITWQEGRMSPIKRNGEIEAILVVSSDVTSRRRAEEEAEKLRQLVPICSWCGKIRSDDGYWSTVESYVERQEHSRVTHGMCPDCQETVAPNGTDGV